MFRKLSLSIIGGLLAVVLAIALLPPRGGDTYADLEVRTVSITGALTLKPLATEVFTASGFEDGETVSLLIGGNVANSGNANASGTYTAAVEVGRTLLFGDVAVQARNDQGEKTDSYTATIEPAIVTSVGSGVVSSPFTAEGYGFAQTELYTATFTDVPDAGLISIGLDENAKYARIASYSVPSEANERFV